MRCRRSSEGRVWVLERRKHVFPLPSLPSGDGEPSGRRCAEVGLGSANGARLRPSAGSELTQEPPCLSCCFSCAGGKAAGPAISGALPGWEPPLPAVCGVFSVWTGLHLALVFL